MTSRNASNPESLSGPGVPGPLVAEGSGTQTASSSQTLPQPKMVQECLAIVDEFKRSRISKTYVIYQLSHIIGDGIDDPIDEEAITTVTDSYLQMLDRWESEMGKVSVDHPRVLPEERRAAHIADFEDVDEQPLPPRKRVKLDMPCLKRPPKLSDSISKTRGIP